jgi:hypothetical protein
MDVAGLSTDDMWDVSQPSGLYIHPERGLVWPGSQLPSGLSDNDGMKELSHRTGGKACTAGNSLKFCMDQAMAESSDYYLLGFYVSQSQRKVGWHKLKVNVGFDYGEVRARNTYYLRPLGEPQQQEQENDLRSAISAAVEYTGISFSVEPGTRTNNATAPVTFKVSVPANSILMLPGQQKLSFDVIAIPLSKNGRPIGEQSRIVKLDMPPDIAQTALVKGWNLVNSVPADPALAAVKIVIRDNNTGRIGSIIFPVSTAAAGS